jgi:hypothetical protein
MILQLSKEEIIKAILEWANNRMDFDFQEHEFNTVDIGIKHNNIQDCIVSWFERVPVPVKVETESEKIYNDYFNNQDK